MWHTKPFLNIAYNLLAGGDRLEDIELLRNDDAWLDALGAETIPDPTTSGDFLRRFSEGQIIELMDAKNIIRQKIWEKQPENFKKEAVINADGTLCETFGSCKSGMDISYNGKWGYAPLIISLANVIDLASRLVAWMKGFPPDLVVPRIFPPRTNRLDGFNKNIMQFCN